MNYRARFILIFLYANDVVKAGITGEHIDNLIQKHDAGDSLELQDFIGQFIRNDCTWMTSLGIIEAADHVLKCSIENGLINKAQ